MKSFKVLAFAMFSVNLLLITSCLSNEGTVVDAMEVEYLLDNEEEYDGNLVLVVGFYVQENGYAILFPDRKSYEEFSTQRAIWIGPDLVGHNTVRKNRVHAIICGRFDSRNLGTFDMFKGQIYDLEKFEVLTNGERQKGSVLGRPNIQ